MLYGNEANETGGGAVSSSVGCKLYNCTVVGNKAQLNGGGISRPAYHSDIIAKNCIIYFNYAADNDNWYNASDSWGNLKIQYSCSEPLFSGTGNINSNPEFVDTNTANYRLKSSSPCINTGSNSYVYGKTDFDGYLRIAGGRVDMGCYEFNSTPAVDKFADANSLPEYYDAAYSSNTNATPEPGESQHAGNGGPFHSVWWNWQKPGDSLTSMKFKSADGDLLLVDTHGSDFDTVLAVYTGSEITNLTEVASNDDAGSGTNTSEVIFTFVPNETYNIAVDGKTGSDTGNIVLNYEIIPEPFSGIFIFFFIFLLEKKINLF